MLAADAQTQIGAGLTAVVGSHLDQLADTDLIQMLERIALVTVCISDKPIASPLVTTCDVLVAMNGPSLDKFEDMLVPGGHLFVNASVINYKARRTDVNVHYVDCTHIAEHEVGNGKTANMVMLGAIIRASGVVSLDIMDKVLAKTMTGKKAALIPANKTALSAWKE